MSYVSTKKKDDEIDLKQVEYLEHRMMFLGHSFTTTGKDKSINFSFNDYSDDGEKIVIEANDKTRGIINKLYNTSNNCQKIKNYINCEKILYNFLNNGCVSIIICYKVHNIDFMLNGYQKIAGENFIKINETLFIEIKDIIERNVEYKECFEFIIETKYGIPEKFLENNDTSFVTDTMVYSQHFIMKEKNSIFLEKQKNKDIKQLFKDIKNSKKEFENLKDVKYKPLKFGWGIRYWEEVEAKCQYLENNKFDFLDTEFLFLSRQVLVNSQIIISTEISNKIIFDKEFSSKIDIEDLELFICVYNIFHQKNDLMLMDFDENTKIINNVFFKDDNFEDLEGSKCNSEDTIKKILNNYQTKRNKISTIVIDIILIIIAALTIYSVTHDFFQFTDLKIPNEKISIKTITKNENGNEIFTETITENKNGIKTKIKTDKNGNITVIETETETKTENEDETVTVTTETETKTIIDGKETKKVKTTETITENENEIEIIKLILNATFNPIKMLVLIVPTLIIFGIILYILKKKYKIRILKRFKIESR